MTLKLQKYRHVCTSVPTYVFLLDSSVVGNDIGLNVLILITVII